MTFHSSLTLTTKGCPMKGVDSLFKTPKDCVTLCNYIVEHISSGCYTEKNKMWLHGESIDGS